MTGRFLRAAALAVAVAVVGACSPDAVAPLPPAPKVATTTTTTTVDHSQIGLGPNAPGRTTTTVAMGPGRATLNGAVTGPDGPVPGAVVRAERFVGDATATADVLTAADGSFSLPAVLGGRYRVRAWKPAPDNLALVEPVVFFLEGSETKRVSLTIREFRGTSASAAIAPDPPILDERSNLVVLVVNQSVDGAGIVRSEPLPGIRVELFGSGDWRLLSPVATTADSAGKAQWQLVCRRAGNQPLSVVVGETDTFNLNLPPCTVPPADEGEAESTPESTTTTAAPGPTSSTTSTTRPPTTTTTTRSSTTTSTTAPARGPAPTRPDD